MLNAPKNLEEEPEEIRKRVQAAIDKRVAEGWEVQTITVHVDHYNMYTGPENLLLFKK